MAAVMAAAEKSKFSSGSINFLYWESGESKTVRFLSEAEEIFVVKVHERVLDKLGKKKTFICRKEFDAECVLCKAEFRARDIGWGLAVLRQEVIEEDEKTGKKVVTGYKDFTHEVEIEEDGKKSKKTRPFIGIVNQSPNNFWTYVNAVEQKYGSLKSFDTEVKRVGADRKTQYIFFPSPAVEIPDMDKRYTKFAPDLGGYLERLGSAEYYEKHLGTGEVAAPAEDEDPFPETTSDKTSDVPLSEFEKLAAKQKELGKSDPADEYY